jgi:hypothetical protein
MPSVSVKLSGAALEAFGSKGRAKSAVNRVARKASRTSLRDMRSTAVKVVRESKRLKARAVRKAIVARKNTGRQLDRMEWGVDIRGERTRLIDYPARQTKKGVSVEINRGQRVLIRGAFITVVGGHKGVFKRKGAARLPIKELLASRALDVLKTKRAARAVTRRGRMSFQKTFDRLLPIEIGKIKS